MSMAAGSLAAVLLALSSTTSATAAGPHPSPAGSRAINGPLKVCGTQLCDGTGQAVELNGMSTHGTQWFPKCVTSKSVGALATDWRADVLRISTYVQDEGYQDDPAKFTARAQKFVDMAHARGMYAIIDWHMLDPGDPYFNLERAKTFFTAMAKKYKDHPGVLYEIANEPSGVSWSRIKSYTEKIIPVIRAQDPDSVILVGTRAWSSFGVSEDSDESEVVNNPVKASNIMYTFHFYAASHREEYLSALDRASDKLPVFVTEFGTQNYEGEGANDFAMAQKYLDLMKRKKISWVNWNYSDDHRSGAVFKKGVCDTDDTWTGTSILKEAGVWIRDRIRA
ncbi:glycoside hydrolase family 5 protein [Streptomyces sp. NPDC048442]|uniref:glycoside hydrolase family 5 protein n=1 Tax=Streptomyces sp. NPDC048442 TaxID=3154823 RepID=UPI0034489826